MTEEALPASLENILVPDSEPDAVFSALVPALCEVLQCDRTFLYLRNPHTHIGKVAYCFNRSPQYPHLTDSEWQAEPEFLATEDPLWAAALRTEASIFVEDVEIASPAVVNKAFEQKHFGHRALIHAHLCWDNLLWGILQPCVFGQPRVWTVFDRAVIFTVIEKITPLAVTYVQNAKI